jgi:hypothetical protein
VFGLVLLFASVSTGDLVTLKFQANKRPPLAPSPHSVGSSASSANSSTDQKPCAALYVARSVGYIDLAHPALFSMDTWCSLPGVKQPGHEADSSPQSSSDGKRASLRTSTRLCVFVLCLIKLSTGGTFPGRLHSVLTQGTTA